MITLNLILVAIFCAFLNNSFCQEVGHEFRCDGVRENDYVRNVSDCNAWIRCKANGTIASGVCPDLYYFNHLTQKCTKDNSSCYTCPDSETGFSNEYIVNSCNRFIRCIKNVATEQLCEEGLQFNQNTGQCDHESEVGCTKNFTCSLNLREGEFYAINHPANCSM